MFLRDHGRLPGDVSFRSVEVAWKYKMSELQAALGRVQLDRIEELIARKRQIFGWYAERLADAPLTLNVERPGDRKTYWMVTAVLDPRLGITADTLRGRPGRLTVSPPDRSSRHCASLPAFAGSPDVDRARRRNRVSYDLAPRAINLPSALDPDRARKSTGCVRRSYTPSPPPAARSVLLS